MSWVVIRIHFWYREDKVCIYSKCKLSIFIPKTIVFGMKIKKKETLQKTEVRTKLRWNNFVTAWGIHKTCFVYWKRIVLILLAFIYRATKGTVHLKLNDTQLIGLRQHKAFEKSSSFHQIACNVGHTCSDKFQNVGCSDFSTHPITLPALSLPVNNRGLCTPQWCCPQQTWQDCLSCMRFLSSPWSAIGWKKTLMSKRVTVC